jgi:hypothetical protein
MSVFGDKRTLIAAARGDREAVAKVIRQSLPKVHSRIDDARETIDRYHRTEWDADARREEAFNGDVDPDAAVAAVNEIYRRVLGVTHLVPLVLIAQGDEREVYEEKLGDNAYNLLLAVHNPTIRYAIIGGLDPEIREQADELAGQISAEVWGTLLATTDSGDLALDDFPEGTREVLSQIADSLGEMEGER